MTVTEKQRVVSMFLRGDTVATIATFYGVRWGTVEDVLREALAGLARLNEALRTPVAEDVAALQSEITLVESK